jgi:hypothetical protein
MNFKEKRCGDLGWIQLAQDKVQCCAVVSIVMDLQIPLKVGNFFLS